MNIKHKIKKIFSYISIKKKSEFQITLCTTPNESYAKKIAHILLKKKLAACITIVPNIISLYYWQQKLKQEKEIQLLIKSNTSMQKEINTEIKKHHPYKIPEIISLPITYCDKKYSLWIKENLFQE